MPRTHDSYPSLISPRSPSYERAWHEFPRASPPGNAETIALLAGLSEAEHNASNLCTEMVPALAGNFFAGIVRDHAELHAARRQALAKLIEQLGGSVATIVADRVHLRRAWDAARHAHTREDATDALTLMRKELRTEYEEALRSPHLNEAQRFALSALSPIETPAY